MFVEIKSISFLTHHSTAEKVVIIFTYDVRPSGQKTKKVDTWKTKIRAMKDTMHKNDDPPLAGAWWVTLNSPDLHS